MYCYTPPKKNKHKDTIILLGAIATAFILAFTIVSFEDHTIYIDNGEIEETPEFNPCDLKEVTCGETTKTTEELLKIYFKDEWRLAKAIMLAESGGNEKAINTNTNGTKDRGLFQINSIHKETNLFDPEHNIEVAYKVYKKQGWTAWSAYNNKSYKKFL